MENGYEAAVELPDDGISKSELEAMQDLGLRRRLTQAAHKVGRFDWRLGILPKAANSNGKVHRAGEGTGGSAEGGAERHARRQQTPVFGDEAGIGRGAGGGATGSGRHGGGRGGNGSAPSAPIDPVEIIWSPTTRKLATDACGQALARFAWRLYKRGKLLAIVDLPDPSENDHLAQEQAEMEAGGRKKTTVWVDVELKRARLVTHASDLKRQLDEANILFMGTGRGRPSKDPNESKTHPIHPPEDPLNIIAKDTSLCPARRLLGISRLPFMDDAGNLDTRTDYYNPQTQVFYDTAGLSLLSIPDQPSWEQVDAAIDVLMHPFSLYEHADDIQWMGEILTFEFTAIERTAIRSCPMLMVAGNAAGLGKGELCRGVIYLAYGVKGDLITVGEDKLERDKRIDAVLIDGAPAFTIDNMNDQVFDSVTLASIATEGVANIRPFGRNSGQIRVEGLALVMTNGNKLFVVGDNVRRTFRIELNTRNPFPATRLFPFTPEEEVRRTRTEMLEAAFTIMRWWRQRGMKGEAPGSGRQLGSFETWSRKVADLVHELTWRRAKAAGGKRKAREGKVVGEATMKTKFGGGYSPVTAIEQNFKDDPFRRNNEDALELVIERFGLGVSINAAHVAQVTAAVERMGREGVPYGLGILGVDARLFPALVQAERNVRIVEAALKTGREQGWKAAGASQEDLESALERVKKIVDDEKAAAHKSQSELDVNMTQALAKVTKNGNVTGLAIGNWFGKIAGTVVGDKMLSIDKSNPNRRVNQVIIERI